MVGHHITQCEDLSSSLSTTANQICIIMEQHNIEKYLKRKGFKLDTSYHGNKVYEKHVSSYEVLRIRICTETNTIDNVYYKEIAMSNFQRTQSIDMSTIRSFNKLKLLLKILFTNF